MVEMPVDPLFKVEDISGTREIAPHITTILNIKGAHELISIHEFAARICHLLLVEVGFFPLDGTRDTKPQDVMDMKDSKRISEFATKISTACLHPTVYALKYKVIQSELRDGISKDVEMEGETEIVNETSNKQQAWGYYWSEDVSVTMLIMGDSVNLTAACPVGEEGRPASLHFTLNIEEFFTNRTMVVPVALQADEWMSKFEINFPRLSVYLKNKFCIHFLDLLDGVMFEKRGLFSLPYLVLLQILNKSDVVTVIRMAKTCTYLYNIAMDNRLWKRLLERDFPQAASRLKTEPEPDYILTYRETFAAKHRRLLRINSLPVRFFPTPREGRRFPSFIFPGF